MKRFSLYRASCFLALAAAFILAASALAEEGMWTLDNPPLKQLKEKYGFEPTPQWLEHIRLSSVRVGDGGSGSFISPNGLVLTNHHVALGQLQKMSTPQKNYVAQGFYAPTLAEEMACPDLELNVLYSMENVTDRVQKAVKPGLTPKQALEARKAEIAKIEKESLTKTGLRSDVVTLYGGGEYWLYRYKKYTEVKLVFAPEQQIAFYGGNPDNFTYPRYDLDMAIFRAYENGQPAKVAHYLKWNPKGAADGELVFVSGHPGSSNRLLTMAQLLYQRDFYYPNRLASYKRRLEVCQAYAALGSEQARQAAGLIFGLENSLKASTGEYKALISAQMMQTKAKKEKEFRSLIDSKPELKQAIGDPFETIAAAIEKIKPRLNELNYRNLPGLSLGRTALGIVRLVAEVNKPDGQRLEGYHDSQLDSLKFRLFSPAPVYPGLEEALGIDAVKQMIDKLGPQDPFVKVVLEFGTTPEEAVKTLLAGTKLADPNVRRQLVAGGQKAVDRCTDTFIVLARRVDPILRDMIKWQENNIESFTRPAGEKIGQALFAVYGKSLAPDATFTLRLTYGTVKGYPMNGTLAPSKTTFYGLYDRAVSFDFKSPFHLPKRYLENQDKIDLATPINFVSTLDIIGGNSGSPVINRDGELVGLVFDGNIESLVGRFLYDETTSRCVSVHSAAITEALKKLYGTENLAKEIMGEK
jgi:hypothetical protein